MCLKYFQKDEIIPKRSLADLISLFELFIQSSIPKLSRHYQEKKFKLFQFILCTVDGCKIVKSVRPDDQEVFKLNCAPITRPKFLQIIRFCEIPVRVFENIFQLTKQQLNCSNNCYCHN